MRKSFKIWGKETPCTEFLGEIGLTEEKKKELWIKVCSDNVDVQAWIEREIPFSKSAPNRFYNILIKNKERVLKGYINYIDRILEIEKINYRF